MRRVRQSHPSRNTPVPPLSDAHEKPRRASPWRQGRQRPSARRILWIAACYLIAASLLFTVLVTSTALCMQASTADGVLTEQDLTEGGDRMYDCILVLGAGLKADGTPSDMLADRVTTAVHLYGPAGRVPLLMSGDHTGDYNEVRAMKSLAVSLGVDSEDVFLDHQGYSTYESLYRAREVFGARRVLIVTQEYHLYRALFIARTLGMEADGVAADRRPYRGEAVRQTREFLARYKDMFLSLRGEPIGDVSGSVSLWGNGDDT